MIDHGADHNHNDVEHDNVEKAAKVGGYDAILVVSFGGPEGHDDVLPFLENVTRGRGVPRERLEVVAEHYHARGGVSPINGQVRELIAAIRADHDRRGIEVPIYWGNRNWEPFLDDAVAQMAADGIESAAAFVTSAFSSYSGCRQYRENILASQSNVSGAPRIDKLRVFYDHPGFIEPMIDNVAAALAGLDDASRSPKLLFTAHSVPLSMARTSDYQAQLAESCRLIAEGVGRSDWDLVFQSRSGPPSMPWLEPDICDAIADVGATGSADGVVVIPVGFVSDHMEVIQDLDTDAAAAAGQAGLPFSRAATVGVDPRFAALVTDLVLERSGVIESQALGSLPPRPPECAADCCPAPQRRPAAPPRTPT